MSVGQIVGGVVGAVIGTFAGGNTMLGAQLGMMIGGMLDPPRTPTQEGPRVSDLTTQTASYGAVIPRVYGTDAISGNLIWLENNKIKETATKTNSSGKGGGSKTSTRTYTYSATFAVGLCKGPIVGIRRMWIGPDLVYDAGSSDTATILASNQSAVGWTLYLGSNTQGADPRMQATLGVANTPAYRGLAYLVFEDFALAKYGNSLAGVQVRAEVMKVAAIYNYPLTEHPGATPAKQWSRPAWNGSVFCAIDTGQTTSNKTCITSPDGVAWTSYNLPAIGGDETDWTDIAASSSGTFIAVRFWNYTSQVARSTDNGQTWSWVSLPITGSPNRVCYGNGRFVITCSSAHSRAYVSTNEGISWSYYSLPRVPGSSSYLYYSPLFSKYYISVYASGVSYVLSSSDGATWVDTTIPSYTGWNWFVELNGTLILFHKNSATGDMRTTDGSTWSQTTGTGGYFGVATDGQVLIFIKGSSYLVTADLVNFTETSFTYYSGAGWATPCWSGSVLSVVSQSETRCLTIIRQMVAPGVETLSSVVSQECLQSSTLSAEDIDAPSLTQQVRGYSVGMIGSIRSTIEPLRASWPFDIRQHGYKVQFISRPGTAIITIPVTDLDARQGNPGVITTISRIPDLLIVSKVVVDYKDADREYYLGEQYASRMTTQSVNQATIEMPIVLTSDEAAGKAETLLYLYWLERRDVSFTLPGTYNQLEAGDVVDLTTQEGVLSLRLIGVNNTSDGRVECKAKYNSLSVYTPTAIGASPAVSGPTTITPVGPSTCILLDIPIVRNEQNQPCYVAAMCGTTPGWPGGQLLMSVDSGASWTTIRDFDPPGATMGAATNAIAAAAEYGVVDNASILHVTLTNGELFSVTEAVMFAGGNHFAYGVPGRWEIIAASTVTLQSGSSYYLGDMLRGRSGTEWAAGLHAVGDSIVLLDSNTVSLISVEPSAIGQSRIFRAVTSGRDLSTATNLSFTYSAVNLKPLSGYGGGATRDTSTGDWVISVHRRSRIIDEWRDYVDIDVGESPEAYQFDICTDSTYAVVVRTLDGTLVANGASAGYSLADQTTDFGSGQTTIYYIAYQMSSTVGRGYPMYRTYVR